MKSLTIIRASLALAASAASTIAFGDPRPGPASCAGYEASDVSPPGSEDGPFSQFGMPPGIIAFIRTIIAATSMNIGNVISVLSQVH